MSKFALVPGIDALVVTEQDAFKKAYPNYLRGAVRVYIHPLKAVVVAPLSKYRKASLPCPKEASAEAIKPSVHPASVAVIAIVVIEL